MTATLVRRTAIAFTQALECTADKTLTPFVEALRQLDPSAARPMPPQKRRHPVTSHLPRALAQARGDQRLIDAIAATIPHLAWASSYDPDGRLGFLATGMAWAEIVGSGGIVKTPHVRLGCFLLSPGLGYPLHGHMAEEIYFVLSGRLEIEHGLDGRRVPLEPGQYFHTPPGDAHALHIGDAPVLIVYQWVGDLQSRAWFWERDGVGAWEKFTVEPARQ